MNFKPVDKTEVRQTPSNYLELDQLLLPSERLALEPYNDFSRLMKNFIFEGAKSLDIPEQETNRNFWRIFSTLIASSELAGAIPEGIIPATQMIRKKELGMAFSEGIFNLELITGGGGINTRLFEVGFLQNPEGESIVKKVQKHRLGLVYRNLSANKGSQAVMEEKARADNWFREFKKQTGFRPELFGLLLAGFTLISRSRSDYMLICDKENHPSIIYRREKIREIETKGVYQGADYTSEEKITRLRDEIKRIMPFVDFKGMLSEMGVGVLPGALGYHRVKLSALENGVQRSWGDDAGYNRLPYRKILYGALQYN